MARSVLRAAPDDRFIGSPPLAFTFGLGGIVLFPFRIGAAGRAAGDRSAPRRPCSTRSSATVPP
jgi:2-aminobenzoate-CoA ligase